MHERIHYPGAVYHIVSRGTEGRPIFLDDQDRQAFLRDLLIAKESPGINVFAYCLMTNHFHLAAQALAEPIGRAMHRLLSRYSNRFNGRHERQGHLFQSRYKAYLCERPGYLLRLIQYIHLNPVRAGITAEAGQWPWSSHRAMLGEADPIVDRTKLCGLIEVSEDGLADAYRALVPAEEPELAAREEENPSLERLADLASASCGIDAVQMLSGKTGRPFTAAKLKLLDWARNRGYSIAQVAAFLRNHERSLYKLRQYHAG